jgi:hypothetical protein
LDPDHTINKTDGAIKLMDLSISSATEQRLGSSLVLFRYVGAIPALIVPKNGALAELDERLRGWDDGGPHSLANRKADQE